MLQDLFVRPEDIVGVAITGGVIALLFVISLVRWLWHLLVPPRPVALGVKEWAHFQQRRWSNPGATRRLLLFLGGSIACIGSTIAVPWWLGLARSPLWYMDEWWLALFFGVVTASITIGFWMARRTVHRCARCRSASLHKFMGRHEWIYVCSACEIVWRTGLPTRSERT